MPIRWPAFTPAWTCGKISDEGPTGKSASHPQSAGVRSVSGTARSTSVEGLSRAVGRKSSGCDYPLHWQMDPDFSPNHLERDSSAEAGRTSVAYPLPPHDWFVCIFLRQPASDHIR